VTVDSVTTTTVCSHFFFSWDCFPIIPWWW